MDQVAVFPIMRKTGDFYARIFSFLKSAGTPIPTNDMWIAACVVESGATLLSFDGHFTNVPLIDVRILET